MSLSPTPKSPAPRNLDPVLDHVLGARFTDLPDEAVNAARIFWLDTLGVGLSGGTAPFADIVLKGALAAGSGEEAGVLGRRQRLPAAGAALVNGFQIHCQEFDCVHEPAVVHPMAVIGGALLACLDREAARGRRVGGEELVTALAVGVDIAAGLGVAANGPVTFFRPANAGGFGAVAACARLMGLSRDQLKDAFGLQLGQCSGTMQAHVEGKPLLPLQVAVNARAALLACDLALAGFPGPHDVFEGPFGYLSLMEPDHGWPEIVGTLGQIWRIAEVSHKPYPTGRAAQAGISGLLELREGHGFGPDQVAAVRVMGPPLVHRLVGRPLQPEMAVNYARLCMGYCGAVALTFGLVDVPHFRPPHLNDPALHALGAKITVHVDGNPDPNALAPQRVEVDLRDGQHLAIDIPATLGGPANPLTRAQHLDKFRRNCSHAPEPVEPGAAERAINLNDRLETLADVQELLACLRP